MAFAVEAVEGDLNGIALSGWSDDNDFIMVPDAKQHTRTRIGGDGRRLRVLDPVRKGGVIGLKFLPDAPPVPQISRLVEMSKNELDIVEFELSLVHRGAGGGSLQAVGGVLFEAPDWWTFGAGDVSNMVYTFDFEEIIGNWDGVSFD